MPRNRLFTAPSKGPRNKYVVGTASIWFADADGVTHRADPEEVVELDAVQAKHFRSKLLPWIPEEDLDEEELDDEPMTPRATMLPGGEAAAP